MEPKVAEVVEVATTEVVEAVVIPLYDKIGEVMTGVFLIILSALMLYRCARAFHSYIYTGGWDKLLKSSVFTTLVDEHPEDSIKAFFTGTHPFGIFVDGLCCFVIVLLMPFSWGIITPIMLIMLLAYVMRQRIAHKQTFVAKLDGSHPEIRGGQNIDQAATTQIYSGKGGSTKHV